jgi:preprotein translocase SecE subunit
MILFLKSSIEELKKLQFPSKRETYVTTITILVTIIIFSLAILLADFLISEVIELILDLRSL